MEIRVFLRLFAFVAVCICAKTLDRVRIRGRVNCRNEPYANAAVRLVDKISKYDNSLILFV